MNSARSEVLQALAQRIQEIEGTGPSRRQSPLSLGIGPVDALLPNGRLPAGSLVELLSTADGAGAGVGFVLRPAQALQAPSFANLRLVITPLASVGRISNPSEWAGRISNPSERAGRIGNPSYEPKAPSADGARRLRVDVVRCRG